MAGTVDPKTATREQLANLMVGRDVELKVPKGPAHPGEIVLYPGGVSETEILLAYGYVNFASKAGQLAGNHFATIVEGNEQLRDLGKKFLWEGAQEIAFREE